MDIPIPYVSKNSGDVYSSPFPGAYIIRTEITSSNSRFTPIYHSVGRIINDSTTSNTGRPRNIKNSFDEDNTSGYEYHITSTSSTNVTDFTGHIMVLPGFKLIAYWRVDYTEPNNSTSYKITVDNTDGKDMKYHSITSGTNIGGFKLFKKTHNGYTREVFPYKKYTYSVGGGTLEVHASVTEDSNDSNSKRYDDSTTNIIEFYDVGRIYYTHPSNNSVDVSCLIVGGGGGGGENLRSNNSSQTYYYNSLYSFYTGGGGGGGGGFGEGNFEILPNVTYEISVGRGGPGYNYSDAYSTGIPGGDSTIIDSSNNTTIISYGGGAGLFHHNSNQYGGSGGGNMQNDDNQAHTWDNNYLKRGELINYPTYPTNTNTSMTFYGNHGGNHGGYGSGGGGGAGGAGNNGGRATLTNTGNYTSTLNRGGGHGGIGKQWSRVTSDTTTYAGGGGGGGAYLNDPYWGYWGEGESGGGDFHGGGGGGLGETVSKPNKNTSGYSGCIKLHL
jgi:hypothetical protein